MNASSPCFEIVRFAFRGDVPLSHQIESLRRLGQWAVRQPGYLARQSYHDPNAKLWTDIVEWDCLQNAHDAMERSRKDVSLADLMAQIDPETVHAGHFNRLL
jgi:hypothetical protein